MLIAIGILAFVAALIGWGWWMNVEERRREAAAEWERLRSHHKR